MGFESIYKGVQKYSTKYFKYEIMWVHSWKIAFFCFSCIVPPFILINFFFKENQLISYFEALTYSILQLSIWSTVPHFNFLWLPNREKCLCQ